MGSTEHELPPEQQDWYHFQRLTQLTNHWQRPGWTDGRRSYHWLLALDNEPELASLARQCQASLSDLPMLDLVPPDTLHLTLQRVGFADEVDRAELQAVADMTAQRCADLTSFVLHVGWLAGSEGAIRFTALPVEPVVRVRQAVHKTLTDLYGPATNPSTESTTFWPHVSIAYCNRPTPARPVIEQVSPLRSLAPAKVCAQGLNLVELRQDDRVYRWETIARVEFKP